MTTAPCTEATQTEGEFPLFYDFENQVLLKDFQVISYRKMSWCKPSHVKQLITFITKHEVHTTFITLLTSAIANERQSEPFRYTNIKLKQDSTLSCYIKIPTTQQNLQ